MFGWHELQQYHPLLALCSGIAAFYCFRGAGRLGFLLMRASNSGVLGRALELVLGVLAISFAVQMLAIAGHSSPTAAQILASLIVLPGIIAAVADIRKLRQLFIAARWQFASLAWWIPVAVVAITLLAAAIAPESRADETAYHALIPARILEDGGLRVYELPWEATIWPQLVWHYSLVPIFATVGSSAARVLSCCVLILLALTVAAIVHSRLRSEKFAALACFAVLAGVYPITLLVTLGPHAFGYLAAFTACCMVVPLGANGEPASRTTTALRIGIACAGMIAGKITMLPLAVLVMALAARDSMSHAQTTLSGRMKVFATLVAPSGLALGPIVIWGWIAAHSPLGVMTADLFNSPAFGPESLRIYQGTRELFANMFMWRFELSYWNLLLAIGLISSVVVASPGQSRFRYLLLLGCQAAVIVLLLPKEIRHFGGLQYVLFVGGFCALISQLTLRQLPESWMAVGSFVAIAPWAALSLYVSSIYLPLMMGRETPTGFLQHYSGLFEDYQRLDRILPADAKISLGHSATSPTQFAWFARPPVFYVPRRMAANDQVPDDDAPLYLLYIGQGAPDPARRNELIRFDPVLPTGLIVGKLVYSNESALFYPSRTPNSSAGRRTRIDVYELQRGR